MTKHVFHSQLFCQMRDSDKDVIRSLWSKFGMTAFTTADAAPELPPRRIRTYSEKYNILRCVKKEFRHECKRVVKVYKFTQEAKDVMTEVERDYERFY